MNYKKLNPYHNSPEQVLMAKENYNKGCAGCKHHHKPKTGTFKWYCDLEVKGYPNLGEKECEFFRSRYGKS